MQRQKITLLILVSFAILITMILSLPDTILSEIYKFVRGVDHFIHQATSPDYKDMLLRIIKLRYSDLSNKILFHIDNREKIEDTFHAIQDTTTSIYSNGIRYENYMKIIFGIFPFLMIWLVAIIKLNMGGLMEIQLMQIKLIVTYIL